MIVSEAVRRNRFPCRTPKGWHVSKLKDISRVISGTTPKSGMTEYWNGDIVWITPTDLGRLKARKIVGSERKISKLGFQSCHLELIPRGAIVMSSRAPIGHLGLADVDLCTNQGCKSFVPLDGIHPEFLFYALMFAMPEIQAAGSGATFKEVSKTFLENFLIMVPSRKEDQIRIAKALSEYFTTTHRARVAGETQLEAAKALPAAYLRLVLNSPEAQKWPRKKLGEVISISARIVDPKMPEHSNLPHVNGENIESGSGKLLYLHTAAEEKMTSGKYLFDKGCVLYSKLRPYLRKVTYADFKGLCSADMYPIETNKQYLDPQFLLWILLSEDFTKYANDESRRARMPKLNRDQLFNWESPIPPLNDQQKIAAGLSANMTHNRKLSEQIQSQTNALENLPSAILRKAFNGEL